MKLSTTRLFLWLGLLIARARALVTSITVLSTRTIVAGQPATSALDRAVRRRRRVIALIVGIVQSAGEYAHGTISHTFLVSPVRERVVAAKLFAGALAGVAGRRPSPSSLRWAIAAPGSRRSSVPVHARQPPRSSTLLGIARARGALAGGLGVGLGAALRRQTAAIVVALVWLLVGEPLLVIAGIKEYAPGHAIAAVVVAGERSSELLGLVARASWSRWPTGSGVRRRRSGRDRAHRRELVRVKANTCSRPPGSLDWLGYGPGRARRPRRQGAQPQGRHRPAAAPEADLRHRAVAAPASRASPSTRSTPRASGATSRASPPTRASSSR